MPAVTPPAVASPAPTPLPVIDVAKPCPADWSAMAGDERRRFCAHCERHVHDLSAMRSDAVADLLCSNAGTLCVRFEHAADGQVKTLDYQAPAPGWRRRYRWLVVGILAAVGAGAGRLAWQRQTPPRVTVGSIALPIQAAPTRNATLR